METIALKRLKPEDLESEHICCAIGDDRENRARAEVKKALLARRIPEGHVFLKAEVRGKVFIEYGPAELAWAPLVAPGWLYAPCFWVSGRYAGTGLGSRLLEAAEQDAESAAGLLFLAAAKGKRPFLSDGRYLASKGYGIVDEALGFALFAKPGRKAGPAPRFAEGARSGRLPGSPSGIDLFWSAQCPFVPHFAREMARAAEAAGIPARLHEVDGPESARELRAPPGIFQAYRDGCFLTHELMTPEKFAKLLASNQGDRP